MLRGWDMCMTQQEVHMLATYNSEAARGIVHTQEWQRYMSGLQREFDAERIALAKKQEMPIIGPSSEVGAG